MRQHPVLAVRELPIEKVSGLITRVTPARFSKAQHDDAAPHRLLLNITEGLAFVTLPLTIGLALVAPELVRLLLDEKWLAAIGPLQLLTVYASYLSLVTIFPQILTVKGDACFSMWIGVWTAAILPIGFAVGSRFGPSGIAAAWIIVYPLFTIPLYRRTFERIGLEASPYLRVLWPSLRGTAIMAAAVLSIGAVLPIDLPMVARLGLLVSTGAAVYGVTTVRRQLARMTRLLSSLRRPPSDGATASLAVE
ncbi:MAG: oligosaccharide flippase family protein [Gemmatimonadetes bacterium]|nr:oligosaccharide flippase family protein [Gemmatimonadota bacterium]